MIFCLATKHLPSRGDQKVRAFSSQPDNLCRILSFQYRKSLEPYIGHLQSSIFYITILSPFPKIKGVEE